ncbi:MAG: hypothetical protein QNJ75_04580 [Acidimicrobiia bacterium]|nr:hypothetical protein [Acidimicrobiia bacterium]
MRRVAWLSLGVGLVLAACGGSDGEAGIASGDEEVGSTVATTEAPTTTTVATTEAPTTTTVAVSDDRIVGVWTTSSGYYKHFRSDGTWGIGSSPAGADSNPWVWGTYTFDGNQFTYYTDVRSENCVMRDTFGDGELHGMVGVYDVTFSDDGTEQFRTVVDDPCTGRVGQTTPKMVRYQES